MARRKRGVLSRVSRFTGTFLVFLGLIAVTFVVLRPLEKTFRRGMLEIRDGFIGRVEEFSGAKLEYGSASPSVFGTFDIRNIRLSRPDGSLFLSVGRVRLSFSLLKIIQGKAGEGFHSVWVDRPVFSLDYEKDLSFLGRFSAENREPAQGFMIPRGLLPEDFTFRLRGGEFETRNEGFSFLLTNFNIDGTIRLDRVLFSGRWNARAEAASVLAASMSGRANGDFDLRSGEGSAVIDIPSLSGDSFRLEPLSVSVLLRNRVLEIRKVYDRAPVDIAVTWDAESDELACSFRGDNFLPGDLLTLTGALREYNPFTASRLSGRAELVRKGGELDYTVDVRGTTGAFGGLGRFVPEAAGENVSFILAVTGDRTKAAVEDMFLDSPAGKIRYRGTIGLEPFAPGGTLSVSDFRLPGTEEARGRINGVFHLESGGEEIHVSAEGVNSGGVELHGFRASFYREDGGIAFFCSARCPETNSSDEKSGFSLEGSLDYAPPGIQASLTLDSFSIQNIIDIVSPVAAAPLPEFTRGINEKIALSTEIFFTTDYGHTLYNAPSMVVTYGEAEDVRLDASFSGTDRRFELDRGVLTWNGGGAGLSGYADFSNANDISFSLEASYRDLAYSLSGVMLDGLSLSVRGSYGLEAVFSSSGGGTGGYSGYALGNTIPIPFNNQNALLSFFFSLRYDSPEFWTAGIERFELSDIPAAGGGSASILFSGSADQDGLSVPHLAYDDGLGPLSGTVSAEWEPGFREVSLKAELNNTLRTESYQVNAFYAGGNSFELNMNTTGMSLDRLSRNIRNGKASGDMSFRWDAPDSFKAELSFPSFSFQAADQMMRGTARAALDNTEISLQDVKVSYGSGIEVSLPFFRLNRLEGIAETEARVQSSLEGQVVALDLKGNGAFTALDSWLDYGNIFDTFRGTISLVTQSYGMARAEPSLFVFSAVKEEKGHAISLHGGPRDMLRFNWTPEEGGGGNVYATLSAPSPVRGAFTGFMDSENMDIRVPNLYADMEALWKLIPPIPYIAFPGGLVTGSVRILGPLRDPEFYGTARVTSLKIRVPDYIPEDIRPVPVTVTLSGNEMRFGPVRAAVGNGVGVVTGTFRFEQWIPGNFVLDISVAENTAIPAAFEISGVHANGMVSGNLVLAMEDLIFDVSGDLTARNTIITLNSDEIGLRDVSGTSSNPVSTMVNLRVRSGRQVEFIWPTAEFPIIQAFADVGSGIRIVSDVIARRFTLTGDVQLRSGEIFYLDRNFYLREGSLSFNENETRFDPRISARAEIRDQTDDGPVTVAMIIENGQLRSFEPRFESNPALSQLEILSLLGQNQTGSPAGVRDANMILSITADALTQFTVMRTLQREVRNFLGMDMFSLRTSVLQNIVFQATGLKNVEQENVRAGNYFDNTTVFLGKYIGSDIFVESLFSLKYDPARQDWWGMAVEPEIGLEMRNPLFNIRVNMLLQHPENWYINDITFSMNWRWAF